MDTTGEIIMQISVVEKSLQRFKENYMEEKHLI
jgi:hypothetical protein